MSKRYIIRWTSKVNGRIGQGSRTFDRHDAEQLIAELNNEYPDIQHEIVDAPEPAAQGENEPQRNPVEHALSE